MSRRNVCSYCIDWAVAQWIRMEKAREKNLRKRDRRASAGVLL